VTMQKWPAFDMTATVSCVHRNVGVTTIGWTPRANGLTTTGTGGGAKIFAPGTGAMNVDVTTSARVPMVGMAGVLEIRAPGTGTTVNGGPTTSGLAVPTAGLPNGCEALMDVSGIGTGVNGGVTTNGLGVNVLTTAGAAGLPEIRAARIGAGGVGGVTTSGPGVPIAGLPRGWLAEM